MGKTPRNKGTKSRRESEHQSLSGSIKSSTVSLRGQGLKTSSSPNKFPPNSMESFNTGNLRGTEGVKSQTQISGQQGPNTDSSRLI